MTEEPIPLNAGPLQMIFEPGTGFLRYLRLGGREALRGIYAAVRDHNWDTVRPRIHDLKVETFPGGFAVTFRAVCREGAVDFVWSGRITGEAQGRVTYAMDGVAQATFLRNRIGFCVLHPVPECAGQPCVIEQTTGATTPGVFPRHISPHQPFFDLRALTHEVVPGVRAEVRMEGETFEMEDQRNWTDASFKTYGTPLELPFPVEVAAGTRVTQSVTLTLQGTVPTDLPAPASAVVVCVEDGERSPLPRIGLCFSSEGTLRPLDRERLKALHLSHLRVDLPLGAPDLAERLQRAADDARALGVPLEAAVIVGEAADRELEAFLEWLQRIRPPVAAWLVFSATAKTTPAPLLRAAQTWLSRFDPAAKVGAGTNAYFAELNRNRPPVGADPVAYSLNPQVHAFDDASLVETLAAQAWTVESARSFVGAARLAVTPVTLRPRFNPNATADDDHGAAADPRQKTRFGAGWTLGSVKYLSESAVDSITYYETTGDRGVLEGEVVFPLYHVLADVGAFAGGEVVRTRTSQPLTVEAMTLRRGDAGCVLLANLTGRPQRVTLTESALGAYAWLRQLDAATERRAAREPGAFRASPGHRITVEKGSLTLDLPAHAYCRVAAREEKHG